MEIEALDWQRMLWGDEPPLFLLEVVVRTVIVYVYALLLLRWLGSRTVGQLSTVEFLLVIALGSAVGDAMFYPDVPLLHALLVVTVVVFVNKGLDMLIARSPRAERIIDGVPEEVIRDGVICRSFLRSSTLGTSELFQELRERGVEQLGQVAHAFVEADGALTVFKRGGEPLPGLSIVPPWEIEKPSPASKGTLACMRCGAVTEQPGACRQCGHSHFAAAHHGTRFATNG
jgi:uncharacterized membrane protein YcaP (DUF421 family)